MIRSMSIWIACVWFALAPLASAQVEARLDVEPLEAEIGQPLTLILTVEHEPQAEFAPPSSVLPDDSWILLEDLGKLTLPHPSRPEMDVTVVRWKIASLESGEREFVLPALAWSTRQSSGEAEVASSRLAIKAALAEGEDEPRPARVFREPVFAAPPIRSWPWWVGGLLFAAGFALVLRRRRNAPAPVGESLSPLERLDALEGRSGALGVRATYFELSRLVRSAIDAQCVTASELHEGLTDEEWLVLRGRDLSTEQREKLTALLAKCDEVKYAQVEPTRWSLEESMASARHLARSKSEAESEVAA